ncbi:hypothetical protein PsAD14_01274 [Pseudovibrio sp. Ad14]|nr:hypothetical protein PsW74_05517 [Pseudovibrio sp. W74]KZL10367.1 hypothetical protein PsAD14_01274 [Pseudovibrio sp. Ad14]
MKLKLKSSSINIITIIYGILLYSLYILIYNDVELFEFISIAIFGIVTSVLFHFLFIEEIKSPSEDKDENAD